MSPCCGGLSFLNHCSNASAVVGSCCSVLVQSTVIVFAAPRACWTSSTTRSRKLFSEKGVDVIGSRPSRRRIKLLDSSSPLAESPFFSRASEAQQEVGHDN